MGAKTSNTVDCARLTVMSGKLELYLVEPGDFLAAGVAAAERAYGADSHDVLNRLAIVVIQPDTIARRQVEQCVAYLREHDFQLVVAVPFTLSPDRAEPLWRFQSNVISPGSKAIGHAGYCHGESIMLLLKDLRATAGAPGSCRIAGIKGSSDPARRAAGSLRDDLGALNRVFGSVHCPDEPLDVLREMAVMLPTAMLERTHERIAAGFHATTEYDCRPETAGVYERNPAHDLDAALALQRLTAAVAAADAAGTHAKPLNEMIADADRGVASLDWFAFSAALTDLGIDPNGWDPLLVASGRVQYEVPGKVELIPTYTGQ